MTTKPADVALRVRPEQLAYIDELRSKYGRKSLHEAIQLLIERDIRCNMARDRYQRSRHENLHSARMA